jgi:hypothetical protein
VVDVFHLDHPHPTGALHQRQPATQTIAQILDAVVVLGEHERHVGLGRAQLVQPPCGPGAMARQVEHAPQAIATSDLLALALGRATQAHFRQRRLDRIANLPVELGIERDHARYRLAQDRPQGHPGRGAKTDQHDPLVSALAQRTYDADRVLLTVRVVEPTRRVTVVGALPPSTEIHPQTAMSERGQLARVLHPRPAGSDVRLRA